MNWSVGVTTAPREAHYLPQTLDHLRTAGWSDVTVFAEPGSNLEGVDCRIDQRGKPHGCFMNWRIALEQLASRPCDAVALFQDDILLCEGIREFLESDLWPNDRCGAVSLYASAYHPPTAPGWFRIRGENVWGCLALVFRKQVAQRVARHPVGRAWISTLKVDHYVGRVMRAVRSEFWCIRPSLCQHIGEVSALANHGHSGASGRRAAGDFVGVEFDASLLLQKDCI